MSEVHEKLEEAGIDRRRLQAVMDRGDNWGALVHAFECVQVLGVVLATWPSEPDSFDECLTCDTCGRVGNSDDGIEAGGPCQEPCEGIVRRCNEREESDGVSTNR